MKSSMKLPFAILCAVPFIMVLGNSMLIPLLPVIRSELNITLLQVGLIITAFSLPAGITIPLAGFLSDRYGRKIIMAPALIIYGLGGLLAGVSAWLIASPYYLILGSRILQGIGAGGTYQLAMALTGDIFQSQERTKTLGILEASNGIGKVVSPVAGSALGLLIWFAPFFVYGLLAIPVGLAVWFLVKEPDSNRNTIGYMTYCRNLYQVFQAKGLSLISCILSGMAVLFILFGVLSFVADILENKFGITGIFSGLLIAIPVGTMALTSFLSGNYLQKKSGYILKMTVITGLVFVSAAMVIMAIFDNIYLLFFALIVMGIGTGSVLPSVNTFVTSASAEERGGITCLYGSARFFGVALGPLVFGLICLVGKLPLFLGVAALMGLIVLVAVIYIKAKKMLPPEMLTNT